MPTSASYQLFHFPLEIHLSLPWLMILELDPVNTSSLPVGRKWWLLVESVSGGNHRRKGFSFSFSCNLQFFLLGHNYQWCGGHPAGITFWQVSPALPRKDAECVLWVQGYATTQGVSVGARQTVSCWLPMVYITSTYHAIQWSPPQPRR